MITKVSPYRTISNGNGVMRKDINGARHPTVNQWRQSWNGHRVPPPPASGCVLYLPGHPGIGSTLTDFSYNEATGARYNKHGTITGATWVQLPSGVWVLSCDGIDDKINIGNLGANIYCLNMWILPASAITAATTIEQIANWTGTTSGVSTYFGTSTGLLTNETISINDTSGTNTLRTGITDNLTQSWHMITFNWNAGSSWYDIYVDAVLGTMIHAVGGDVALTNISNFQLATDISANTFGNMTFGEVEAWTSSRTVGQLQQIYQAIRGRYS